MLSCAGDEGRGLYPLGRHVEIAVFLSGASISVNIGLCLCHDSTDV